MMTRSRSIRELTQINDETFNSSANGSEKKKRKKTKTDDKHKKPDFSPQLTAVNVSASKTGAKNSRKMKRTQSIVDESELQQTTSKSVKSHENEQKKSDHSVPVDKIFVKCENAIQQVLSSNYMNVQKRLKVMHPAKCIQHLVECHRNHARNGCLVNSDNTAEALTFLNNHHPLMFMHVITMDVLNEKFPGPNLMPLFELIVCINKPPLDEYQVEDVVDMATYTIRRIIDAFPPCWLAANKQYRSILNAKEKQLIKGSEHFSANQTLFDDLIDCIESFIVPPAKQRATKNKDKSHEHDSILDDSLLNDSHDFQSFRKWELKHTQKYSFDILQRDEKIYRVFTTLSLYVQLFEVDLAMWTLRNMENVSNRIFDSQKGPLIGLVLWKNNEPNQVNYTIKNILKLYVDYVSIDFPNGETSTLSRLVNVIFDVFDLAALRHSHDDAVDYPQSVNEPNFFCDALIKIIFESSRCSIELWLKIIKNILHPKLKLHLINALLTKLEHKKITLNPEIIYNLLRDLESEFDDIFDETIRQNNNVVKAKGSTAKATAADDSKYPYLQKVNKCASSTLSHDQNAELQLIALRAYMDIFHIDEFQNYWNNYDRYTAERESALQRYRSDCEAMRKGTVEPPLDLDEMMKCQAIPFNKRVNDSAKTGHIHPLDVIYEVDKIHFEVNANVKRYRNDVKYVNLIASKMIKLRTKFGSLFPIKN